MAKKGELLPLKSMDSGEKHDEKNVIQFMKCLK